MVFTAPGSTLHICLNELVALARCVSRTRGILLDRFPMCRVFETSIRMSCQLGPIVFAGFLAVGCAQRQSLLMNGEAATQAGFLGISAPPLSVDGFVGSAPEWLTWESLEGHVLVIEFWATWCPGCILSIPHLNTLADAYYDKGVRFLSITDEGPEIVERFIEKRPIHGWVGLDPDRSMFEAFSVGAGIPKTFVVNRQGILAAGPIHPDELTTDLLDAVIAGNVLQARANHPVLPAARVNVPPKPHEPSDMPPSQFDESAALQIVIGPAREPMQMEWVSESGSYAHSVIELETLLIRLFNLSTAARISWETQRPTEKLRFVGKFPSGRNDLVQKVAVPALEAILGLRISQETVRTEVVVMTSPNGPGKDLSPGPTGKGVSHQIADAGLLFATGSRFDSLTEHLENLTGHPIVDETGFTGKWSWGLSFEPNDKDSLIRAAREQLGLVLTSEKREIQMVVVRDADTAPSAGAGEQ